MTRRPFVPLLVAFALAVLAGCQDRELPTGVAAPQAERLIVSSPNHFTALGAGAWHSCALRQDGVVECWGAEGESSGGGPRIHGFDFGQAPASRSAASGAFTQVSLGHFHTCALRSDGAVECWGATPGESYAWYTADFGQAPAFRSAASGVFSQVSAGSVHTCALRSDGAVECWGASGMTHDGINVDLGQAPPLRSAAAGSIFTQVSAGDPYTCALRSDGAVECWGAGGDVVRWPAATGSIFTQVSAGHQHTCALRTDGVVECWGDTRHGKAPAVRSAAHGGGFIQVSAGGEHTCALSTSGMVECWGDFTYRQAPLPWLPASGAFTQVSLGSYHTCGLASDGVVECVGDDGKGQAPASREAAPYTTRLLPTATFSASPAAVVAGESFTLALTGAQIPGWPGPVTFTYAFDCGDGSGYGALGPGHTASCATGAAGIRTVRGRVRDHHGDEAEYTATVAVVTFTLGVDASGTIAKQTGAATLSGTLTCSAPLTVTLEVSLSQTQTKGKSSSTVSGGGGTTIACSGTTAWTATVSPTSGKFATGAAQANAELAGFQPTVGTSQTVQLK